MRISDWSSDVCASDLQIPRRGLNQSRIPNPDSRLHRLASRRGSGTVSHLPSTASPMIDIARPPAEEQTGRASCREGVCKYVWISVVAVALKKKKETS